MMDDGRLPSGSGCQPAASAVPASRSGIPDAVALFPFTLHCNERGWSDHALRPTFLAFKPEKLTWYAYDAILHSPQDVEFVVYAMYDNTYGGVGDEIARFHAEAPAHVTRPAIERRAAELAQSYRRAELTEAERVIVEGYAAQILSAQAIEARRAETQGGSVHESAVRQDAPEPHLETPHHRSGEA